MNSIELFANSIIKELSRRFPDIEKMTLNVMDKNNGLRLNGLTIKERGVNVSPVIYIDDFFQKYKDEILSFKNVCEQIAEIYINHKQNNLNVDWFLDFEKVKSALSIKLVNKEDNKELLETLPHFEYGDLAGIYYIKASQFMPLENASIIVKNSHIPKWKISAEELHEAALNDVKGSRAVLKNMMDVLRELAGPDMDFSGELGLEGLEPPMYILTNEEKLNGAVGILNTELLDNISQKLHDNLVILPSSIHEVIILPQKEAGSMGELISMVSDINNTVVDITERLSNNVYYFDKAKKVLCQGINKIPMHIKLRNNEDRGQRPSVLDKLKNNQQQVNEAKTGETKETERPVRRER